jgi:hypothetical protein
MKKITKRYINGFKEGFNNPGQYKNLNINNPLTNTDLFLKGVIDGFCKKATFTIKGEYPFIWNETDLKKYMGDTNANN